LKEIQIANSLKWITSVLAPIDTETKGGVNILGETLLEYAKNQITCCNNWRCKLKDKFPPQIAMRLLELINKNY